MRRYMLFMLGSLSLLVATTYGLDHDQQAFITSFIDHYDFNAAGRYTHEYHPYLLKKTAESFNELESRLRSEGLQLHGRIMVAGYEEQAIPSYYTDFMRQKIDDEASSKGRAGWSLQLHNQFGLMTGFLLQDINQLRNALMTEQQKFFEHINPDEVEIFNDPSGVFQEHAFKDSYPLLKSFSETLHKRAASWHPKSLFNYLINFWQALYSLQGRAGGDMPAGTQDILFSISYAEHLGKSLLPFMKYYTGGDITYPIEATMNQAAAATKNSQAFVKRFAPTLTPIDGKKTVYVFCSFVDGVGKSTMLGNVRNWSTHGDKITQYERVDNSSSQYAQLYEFDSDVYIADLPAQVSHFTYKPDGLVYVPLGDEVTAQEYEQVILQVQAHKDQYTAEYRELLGQAQTIYEQEGPQAPQLNDRENPVFTYAKNVILLKALKSNMMRCWVPFELAGERYLFNYFDPNEIRVLRSLSAAPSAGLKNIESEQMLFYDGVRFPLPYQQFLDDLVGQLKGAEIEEVVFVDFISMYPRSSRENIRINYLMQQMALLDPGFDTQESLYKNFLSPAELYADLTKPDMQQAMFEAFTHEVFIRLALYEFLATQQERDLTGVPLEALTTSIVARMKQGVSGATSSLVTDLCRKKFAREIKQLKKLYGKTKDYVNVQQFSFDWLVSYSSFMVKLFAKQVQHKATNELWSMVDGVPVAASPGSDDQSIQTLQLSNGVSACGLYEFPIEYKDSTYLQPFIHNVRAAWYAALGNLLETIEGDESNHLAQERELVCPHVVVPGKDNNLYLIRPALEQLDEEPPRVPFGYGLSSTQQLDWGVFNEQPYLLDWEPQGTHSRRYAFDCDLTKEESAYRYLTTISELVYDEHKKHGTDRVVTASCLLKKLESSRRWQFERSSLLRKAKNNGIYPGIDVVRARQKQSGLRKLPLYLGRDDQRSNAQLMVVALATLEMILKDPKSDIAVRLGNKKDFAAALYLFEKIVLPKYYGILFEYPLFDDYHAVEPLFGWDAFTDE